jgi:hypothetical protein
MQMNRELKRIKYILEEYDKGRLCECIVKTPVYLPNGEVLEQLIHFKNCTGKDRVRDLIFEESKPVCK